MDLTTLELLDVDDIRVVETDELVAFSSSPGIVNAPGLHHHRHCHPTLCSPVHTHAVGELPDGPPAL